MFYWRECHTEYINLDYRTDRKEHMERELKRVGLKAERFPALKTIDHFWDLRKIKTMVGKGTGGNIGCHYSQIAIMKKALSLGKSAFVMEDDLQFCQDIQERLDYLQRFVNKQNEWDVIFLGGTVHLNPSVWHIKGHSDKLQDCNCELGIDAEPTENNRIVRTYGAFSTHAYIVNKDSIEKILKYFNENVHLSIGIDWLFIKMQPLLKAFMFLPGCVKQYNNKSDIGDGITMFSNFASLGAYWWQDNMNDFDLSTYKW